MPAAVDDLMVALALYRPGPLTGGLKDAFVRAIVVWNRLPTSTRPCSRCLQDTYGVILYQEQVLRIAHELAGFSLAEADLLRRAMSHFDPGKQMQVLQQRFIAGASERSGVPEPVAGRIWEMMAAFAGYGFPKAHAASYARVAWRSAWCKTHYPALFMAAVLANWGGYYSQRVYLTEARRMGLALRPPQVNYALPEFSVRYLEGAPVLFMGLNQVRELTRRTQARILRYRPFTSFMDFLARADPRPQEAENLVRSGALEGFGAIPALLRQLERGGWRGGQLPLFALETPGGEDWTLAEKVAAQEALAGRRSGCPPAGAASRPDRLLRRSHHRRSRRQAQPARARRRYAPDLAPQPHHRRRLYLLHGARRPGRHAGCRHSWRGLPPQPPRPLRSGTLRAGRRGRVRPGERRALHPPRARLDGCRVNQSFVGITAAIFCL